MSKKQRRASKRPRGTPFWRRTATKGQLLAVLLVAVLVGAYLTRSAIPNWLARRAIVERDFDAAGYWTGWARRLNGIDPETRFLEARMARLQGRMSELRELLEEARRLGLPASRLEREEWLAQAQMGQMVMAERHLPTLLEAPGSDLVEICEAYTLGFMRVQKLEQAQQLLGAWASDFPDDPRPLYLRGTIHRDLQLWAPAEEDYRAALAISPEHFEAAVGLANVLLTQKRPEEALKFMQLAERGEATRLEARVGQGHCLRLLGRVDEAREVLSATHQEHPADLACRIELARLELDSANYQSAADLLEPVVQAHPRDSDARFKYAEALRSLGQTKEAMEHMLVGKTINEQMARANSLAERIPSGPEGLAIRIEIAQIHLQYGIEKEGLMWLFGTLDLKPDHKPSLKALADYYEGKLADQSLSADERSQFERQAARYRQLWERAPTADTAVPAASETLRTSHETESDP